MAAGDDDPRACVIAALQTHSVALKRYVRARVPAVDVDDILQAAALRAIERADALRDPERVLPWLYRVHGGVVVDALRKQARERRLLDAAATDVDEVAAEPAPVPPCGCSVAQARQLNANYASILSLVDMGDMPLPAAARTLNISVNNATVRLHRARAALKKKLQDHCGVTSSTACGDCRCSYEGCCAP